MEFITRHCPKCEGELQVPVNLESCICMYCGESFTVCADEKEQPTKEVSLEEVKSLEDAYNRTLQDIPLLIQDYDRYLFYFNAANYAKYFDQLEQLGRELLKPAQEYASLSSENMEIVIKEVATSIYEATEQLLKEKAKKHKEPKSTLIDQLRYFQTVYLVPMLLHLDYKISDPVVDLVIIAWLQAYPAYPYKKSDFERIAMGFGRKGLCFITTAVCETMDKADDCYELTAFREFRDSYMLADETRKCLVDEYYQIAPVVVTAINANPDAETIYREIWESYLKPCLKAIEEKQLTDCERQYSKMVLELKKQYYFVNI